MALRFIKSWFVLLIGAYACSNVSPFWNPANEIQLGRSALLAGKPASALEHFRRVTDSDPNYVNTGSPFNEGPWTYIGRAYYDLGLLNEASDALDYSLGQNENDFMARLYLSLTFLKRITVQAPKDGLSDQDVIFALKERVTPRRLAVLVRQRGVKFLLTAEIEREIRKLGGDNDLIQQIRVKSDAISPSETAKQQGLRQLNRALRDMEKSLHQVLDTPQGRSWDPGRRIRFQINKSQNLMLNKNIVLAELIQGAEWLGRALEREVDLAGKDEPDKVKSPSGQ